MQNKTCTPDTFVLTTTCMLVNAFLTQQAHLPSDEVEKVGWCKKETSMGKSLTEETETIVFKENVHLYRVFPRQ